MAQIVSKRTYGWVWLSLVLLLVATWGFSRLDLKPFNTAIALIIAFAKMLLIILFFMHLRYSRRLLWIFVCAGFLWFLILVDLTLSDYLTRGFSWSQ